MSSNGNNKRPASGASVDSRNKVARRSLKSSRPSSSSSSSSSSILTASNAAAALMAAPESSSSSSLSSASLSASSSSSSSASHQQQPPQPQQRQASASSSSSSSFSSYSVHCAPSSTAAASSSSSSSSFQQQPPPSHSQQQPPLQQSAPAQRFSDVFSFVASTDLYAAAAASSDAYTAEARAAKATLQREQQQQQQQRQHSTRSVLVSRRQRGNPLLPYITNVKYEFADNVVPDYVMSASVCALYLSLKYHRLHTHYLHSRIGAVKSMYTTRILLVHVDLPENETLLEAVTKIAFASNWTVVCVWSFLEAARYIETFKLYARKGADLIKGRVDESDRKQTLLNVLTTIRRVNKTDVGTLLSQYGTIAALTKASVSELVTCPGLGDTKARRIYAALHRPFVASVYGSGGGSGGVGGGGSGSGNSGSGNKDTATVGSVSTDDT